MKDTPKTAIITGASSGIGLGTAQTLLQKGYRVVANSRDITKANTLTPSENLVLIDGDIADKEVAQASWTPPSSTSVASISWSTRRRVLSTNVAGFCNVTQSAITQMLMQKSGHVVNITTTLADQPIAGVTAALANLSKGGLQSVAKALAMEYAAAGIRVNVIAPGVVNTPMHKPETHDFLK